MDLRYNEIMSIVRPEVVRLLAAKEDRRRTLAGLSFPDNGWWFVCSG